MIYSIYLAVHSLIYIIDFVIYVPQWNTSSNLYSTYTLSSRMLHHIITIKLDKLRTMICIEFISTSLKSLSGEGQLTISMIHICQLWPSSYLSAGQTTSHYVKQCSPLSILSFGFTRPQCVNECRWSWFHDITYDISMAVTKRRSDFKLNSSQHTPQTLSSRASYGVSVVRILKNFDSIIRELQYI